MKRRQFISMAGTGITALHTDFTLRTDDERKGFKTLSGTGRTHGHITLKGVNENILDLKVSGTDTNGSLAVFEQTSLSQHRGVPLHIHYRQDEMFYVLEGSYFFQVGDQKFKGEKGDSIFLPAAVPHSWIQLSEKGKMMVLFQPAGQMEEFFVYLAKLTTPPTKPELAQVFASHGMKVVGPPVTYTEA